ncbi:MAG: adenylate/guanylate cyclase domain-containing protein [Desulfobacteraceae bacterium]|nr:adenylate/guanylate cyclase domain-containing protein [Desulfobacteraceae bacterium]
MSGPANFKKKLLQGLITGMIGASIGISLWICGILSILEAKTWDWRLSLLAKPGTATDDIRLILLDQASLDWGRKENSLTWPWPREAYSLIIDYCQKNGATALAFDVLFTEPQRVDEDAALGSAVYKFGRFAASLFLSRENGDKKWPADIPEPKFSVSGLDKWLNSSKAGEINFPLATMPIPEVAKNAAALCNVNVRSDPDNTYRQMKMFSIFDGKFLPSLGLGTYLAENPKVEIHTAPGKLSVGKRNIPIDQKGNAVLRFRGPVGTFRTYSAAAVIQSELRNLSGETPTIRDKNAFKDKYVLFGFSAPGLYDLRNTPLGAYPGVEIHATVLDNFLSEDFVQKTPQWLTILLVIIFALVCSASVSFFSSPAKSAFAGTACLAFPVFLSIMFYVKGYWVPIIPQEAAGIPALALALMVNYITEGKQKRFIKHAFRQYLSPVVIDQLIQNPERLKLGGERKVLSIFFSDLEGFTSISERLDPGELTILLNGYLTEMTVIIQEEGGTVDKYEGDAIIAFWNAPVDVDNHAVKVVRASLRCQKKLAEMRPGIRKYIGMDLMMRIGINTGLAVVGNMGSKTRFDYTMLGDSVNLAARLEGTNKQFGTYTMVSQFTKEQTGNEFAYREIARVAVVGKQEPVTVYEPMYWDEYKAGKKTFDQFAKGLELFYTGFFKQAQGIFASIRDVDPPAAAYEEKCRILAGSTQKNWRGVWVMTTK